MTLPETVQAQLSRLLPSCVLVAASHLRLCCGDGHIHSRPSAEAPERFSRALSISADFTQLLMMLASSLRTSVTDGGSAGLRPLEKAE